MDGFAKLLITKLLVPFFTEGMALGLATVMLVVALGIYFWFHHKNKGLSQALDAVCEALLPVHEAPDDEAARMTLKENYQKIVRSIKESKSERIKRNWAEFEESIVDLQAPVLNNTVRPEEFFHNLSESSRGLLWWANIAVATGLVLTFLGIIAALGSTSTAISTAANSTAMQGALQQLLGVTSAKFLTSAAGVLASIGLRAGDVHLQKAIRNKLNQLVDRLERGLVYLPPQRMAQQQLHHLEQIATAQTKFATELATAIGDKFSEQFTPMVNVLGNIDGTIQRLKDDMVGGIGDKLGESLDSSAGKEMRALGVALAAMSERLGAVPEQLGASADVANARIEAAAELFSQASASMSAAFDALGGKIEAMGEAVVTRQRDAFDGFTGQVREASAAYEMAAANNSQAMSVAGDDLRKLIAEVGGTLAAINGEMAAQAQSQAVATREIADGTRRAMEDAARRAGEDLTHAAADAAKRAAEMSAGSLEQAFSQFTERFAASGKQLTDRLDASATKVQAFGGSMERATEKSGAHAEKLAAAGVAAERLGGQLSGAATETTVLLGRAAASLRDAAEPVRDTNTAIAESMKEVTATIRSQHDNNIAQAEQWRATAAQMEATANAAQQAWEKYSERFGQVDKALGEALIQIVRAASESAEKLNGYAKQVDDNLGNAVNRLAGVVDELSELPDAIEQATRIARAA